jgi:hypothetical protein
MNRMRGVTFNSNCSYCNKNINFSVSTKDCDVKHFACNDFNLILMKINDNYNNFKLKITIICNRCLKVQIINFNIGKRIGQTIKTDDSFTYQCCNQTLSGFAFLTEEEISSHGQLSNNQNNVDARNNNPISNNDNSRNIINDNQNNISDNIEDDFDDNNDYNDENEFRREIENFELNNIIEFRKKDILLNFLDDETKKLYRIYTKSDLKLENVLEDLVNQFPELSYKNKRILINNNKANLSSKINSFNLNAQSNIIIK